MNKLLSAILMISIVIGCSAAYAQENVVPVVAKIEWSSDGTVILAALQEGGIYIIDPSTQTMLLELPGSLTGPIRDAALQPDGDLIAVVGGFNTMIIWNRESGTLIRSITTSGVYPYSVDWSPEGQYLFSSNIDEQMVRDAAGEPLFSIPGGAEEIALAKFSPNGNEILLVFSAKMEVWDVNSQQMLVRNLAGGLIQSIQWNADGTYFLAANVSNRREGTFYNILVINPMTGERIREYSGFPNQLSSASWSPDETEILATSVDGTAYLVDADSGEITPIFTGDVPLLSADWSPYGGQVAIGAPVHSQTGQSLSGTGATIAGVPVHILVPAPTFDRLNAIAEMCVRDAPTPSSAVTGLTSQPVASLDALPDFIAQVEALPADAIPAACRADLLAVAGALR